MLKIALENFIETLKEEALPGVWSKGIQYSRSVKGIELLKSNSATIAPEMKFKIQTPERLVAYEVTLWPQDDDSHCNCGSKIQPCHHIVAVALAYQNGQVQTTETRTGASLVYTLFLQKNAILPELKLRREIVQGESRQLLSGSLVSLIAGIQSGRVTQALPPTTQLDLKIDALLAREKMDWKSLLPLLADLSPIEMEEQGPIQVRASSFASRPKILIRDAVGGVALEMESSANLQNANVVAVPIKIAGGLILANRELKEDHSPRQLRPDEKFIAEEQYHAFLTKKLPELREEFTIEIFTQKLPTLVKGQPKLIFKTHQLKPNEIAVTPSLEYEKPRAGELIERNPAAEQSILKDLRHHFQLALHQTVHLDAKAAFEFKNKLDFPELTSTLDGFLTDTLGELKNISSGTFAANREAILHLLELKQRGKLTGAALTLSQKFLSSTVNESATNKTRAAGQIVNQSTTTELLPDLKIARALWNQLRDYQKIGVNWLAGHAKNRSGCILADDMGLGKTLQAICVLTKPSLVIVPTSLLHNWQQEIARFRPELRVNLYYGSGRAWSADADITLTTYGVLRSEKEKFQADEWACAVLDEAHLIRNAETQAAIASFQINAQFKIALTGTPIQNRVRDLWSLFQFIAPGIFASEHSLTRELVSPFLLRRTKAEVLTELPPKTYLQHEIEFTAEEKKTYDSVWASAKKEVVARLDAGEKLSPLTIFEVLLRVRQTCDHVGLYDQSKWLSHSSKLDSLLEMIEELLEAGHSLLVYSQWTKFLDRIQFSLKEKNQPFFRLDGSTNNRGAVVENFQNSAEARVFLLSLHAGGVGLNLTRADHVIFCDPWWNPFVEIQAEDRAYRMGQEKPVTIHRLICANSIEEKLLALQAEKKKQGASFLENDLGEETPAFTTLDFQNLLFD
jgi:SNF2 family DNA or RNA helicase